MVFGASQRDSRHHLKCKFYIDDTLSVMETTGAFKVSFGRPHGGHLMRRRGSQLLNIYGVV